MSRLKAFVTHPRTLATVGVLAVVAFVLLTARNWRTAFLVLESLLILALLVWGLIWLRRRWRARKGSDGISEMMNAQADDAMRRAGRGKRVELKALKDGLQSAIQTIRSSRIGAHSGRAALYELPWYMLIGNPAAGKSSAILNSGLQFPLEAHSGKSIQGIAGTRSCDWFFTSEGILLDTAGRYSLYRDDREEWLGFLDLLRKHRPRAPLNGVIVAASVADLTEGGEDFARELAQQLRERVQEITDRLEVSVPLYVVFTKADLIAGFCEFFQDLDARERARVWGATVAYAPEQGVRAAERFGDHFDDLYRHLTSLCNARMAHRGGRAGSPAVFGFPLEFAATRPALHSFMEALFAENPFQHNPVFRGFYFTSAMQEGTADAAADARVAERFDLQTAPRASRPAQASQGFFLTRLFREVIFADDGLVKRHTRPARMRLRYAFFAATALFLGLLLAAWTWSYSANRQMLAAVERDIQAASQAQAGQLDLASRFEALDGLLDRIESLEASEYDPPLRMSFGLYQGNELLERLRLELFTGLNSLMIQPVQTRIEAFLQGQGNLAVADTAVTNQNVNTAAANPGTVKDRYNALKAYLMLTDPARVDVTHMYDQLARFWRGWLEANRGGMAREEMVRHGERLISFYLGQVNHPRWPTIQPRLALVADVREDLSAVMSGLTARQRAYTDIKARASTRFPPITVAAILGAGEQPAHRSGLAGSHAISGAFSKQAWEQYVREAIEQAANHELQSDDWVLRSSQGADTTLQGSPEDIRQSLTARYKAEYADEWRKFLRGITIAEFGGFGQAVSSMNQLGDPRRSPMKQLLHAVYRQTAWDNPGKKTQSASVGQVVDNGVIDWFKRVILRRTPHQWNRASYYVDLESSISQHSGTDNAAAEFGRLGGEFSGIARLLRNGENGSSLLAGYLRQLSAIRTRLNAIENEGDTGPGSRILMRQTISGEASELTAALQFIEASLLPALPENQREFVRPLLLRPLIQSYAAIVAPAERELNQQWQAQIHEPFISKLAHKYPFSPDAGIEAANSEISELFGPDGAIARFASQSLDELIIHRGNTVSARTWADIGLSLTPDFTRHFAQWVAPLGAQGRPGANPGGPAQTVFQILPLPAPGTREYSLEIDGQKLNYRNTPSQWSNFVWPNPEGTPGVRLTATSYGGSSLTLVDLPGRFGLQKLIQSSARERLGDNLFGLSWSKEHIQVSIKLRIVSNPQSGESGRNAASLHLPAAIVGEPLRVAGRTP